MKSLFIKIAALALCTICLTSCFVRYNKNADKDSFISATGEVGTTTYDWDDINSIDSNVGDVEYYQVESNGRVEIVADKAFEGKYSVSNNNGNLKIKRNGNIKSITNAKLVIKVYSANIKSIQNAGAGDVVLVNGLNSEDGLSVSLAGSGDLTLGALTVSSLEVALVGSGDIKADALVCGNTELAIVGSGDITIDGIDAESISIAIAGSGDSKLSGKAKSIDSDVAGSGNIDIRNLEVENVKTSKKGSGKLIQ